MNWDQKNNFENQLEKESRIIIPDFYMIFTVTFYGFNEKLWGSEEANLVQVIVSKTWRIT